MIHGMILWKRMFYFANVMGAEMIKRIFILLQIIWNVLVINSSRLMNIKIAHALIVNLDNKVKYDAHF